ncbi:hypothetical protein CHELA20_50180 [Hyphomicrobiales bacterium]|nr:hypothetical protein CHELA41_20192 [Hyphomicrobiales bacterium]CAH1667245.1 hypothetical protein CHELA20_50180 [Hyphomicrobiales bacterium]
MPAGLPVKLIVLGLRNRWGETARYFAHSYSARERANDNGGEQGLTFASGDGTASQRHDVTLTTAIDTPAFKAHAMGRHTESQPRKPAFRFGGQSPGSIIGESGNKRPGLGGGPYHTGLRH